MSEQYTVRELANFLVSADKNDPSDLRHSQASVMLLRLEEELRQRDESLEKRLARWSQSLDVWKRRSKGGLACDDMIRELSSWIYVLIERKKENQRIHDALAKGQENGN